MVVKEYRDIVMGIWVFLFIIVISLCAFIQLQPAKEGFFSPPSFADCRADGFTKEFCVQTPLSAPWLGPDVCRCPSGELGRRLPGFRGECVCSGWWL